jgi:hypothetical protein
MGYLKIKSFFRINLYRFIKFFIKVYVFIPKKIINVSLKFIGRKRPILNLEIAKMLFFSEVKNGTIILNYGNIKEQEFNNFKKDILIIGPWYSEIGYELLYWLPYLWKRFATDIKKYERIIVISRGGVGAWYSWIKRAEYVNIEDIDSKLLNKIFTERKHGSFQKQMKFGTHEKKILDKFFSKYSINKEDCDILDPSFIFLSIWGFLLEERGVKSLKPLLHKDFKIPKNDLHSNIILDENNYFSELQPYIAIKIYSNSCLEINDNSTFYLNKIKLILQRFKKLNYNFVLLDFDIGDDHSQMKLNNELFDDLNIKRMSQMIDEIDVKNNIGIQSQIVKFSKFTLTSYGGFSYLAPMYDLKSLSISNKNEKIIFRHSQTSKIINNQVDNLDLTHDDEIIIKELENFLKKIN